MPAALGAMRQLYDVIALDGDTAAQAQVMRVSQAVTMLASFPQAGRSGRVAGTRGLVIGNTQFIAAYRVKGGEIQLLRILHGRRRWPAAL